MKRSSDLQPQATQSILCCVGERVGGKPTQFLLERAIAACEIDWRAITIEIQAGELGIALAGMNAMKFAGVRFFPSLQSEALRQAAPEDPQLQFVGGITSAAWRAAGGWQAWHHWGWGWRAWAERQVDLAGAWLWLHGDSTRCRSTWIALCQANALGLTIPSRVLWSSPPAGLHSPEEIRQTGGLNCRELPTWRDGLLELQHASAIEPTQAVMVVAEELPTDSAQQFATLDRELRERLRQFPWLVAGPAVALREGASWNLSDLRPLTEADQVVACEIYDFQRWTGQSVAAAVLRDALDEYHGF